MQLNKTIRIADEAGGAYWTITKIVQEENSLFTWLKVWARWAGYGPRPLWADEERTFLMGRRFKNGGHYVS